MSRWSFPSLAGVALARTRSPPSRRYRRRRCWRPCHGARSAGGVAPKVVAGAIKARRVCEQAHQQLNEELGLDHFEGRSWKGLHRHALLSMIAFAFLQSLRLNQARGGKKNRRSATEAKSAGDPASHP